MKAFHLNLTLAIYTAIIITITNGCTNKSKTPADILPKDRMEKILWDMIQADRFASIYVLKDSATKDVRKETFVLYEKVFALHNITAENFIKSYKYYLSRPDLTKTIFDSLSAKANRSKKEIYPQKVDSLL